MTSRHSSAKVMLAIEHIGFEVRVLTEDETGRWSAYRRYLKTPDLEMQLREQESIEKRFKV
jgi:hypothetical protein